MSSSVRSKLTQPILENLERREVPAINFMSLTDGALSIRTDNSATSVTVQNHGSGVRILEEGTRPRAWDFSKVNSITFIGGSGNDTFANKTNSVPVVAFGLGGNDILIGGNETDLLFGGAGDDVLVGGEGNDTLHGQGGTDSLSGGQGNDELISHDSSARDTIKGGQGDDTYWCDSGELVDDLESNENLSVRPWIFPAALCFGCSWPEFYMNGWTKCYMIGGIGVPDIIDFVRTDIVVIAIGNGSNPLEISDGKTFDADVAVSGGNITDADDPNNRIFNNLLILNMGNGFNDFATETIAVIDVSLAYTSESSEVTVTLNHGDGLTDYISIPVSAGADEIAIDNINIVGAISLTTDLGIDGDPNIFDYDAILSPLITILNQGSGDIVNPAYNYS